MGDEYLVTDRAGLGAGETEAGWARTVVAGNRGDTARCDARGIHEQLGWKIGGLATGKVAHEILERSALPEFRRQRYASFDKGKGKAFEDGKLTLTNLRDHAMAVGEPEQVSGRQEWLENLVNDGVARAFITQKS